MAEPADLVPSSPTAVHLVEMVWRRGAEYRARANEHAQAAATCREFLPLYEREVRRLQEGGRPPESFPSRERALAYYESLVAHPRYMLQYRERGALRYGRAASQPWRVLAPEPARPPAIEGRPWSD